MQTYIVQAGDTLFGISKQFGVPIHELEIANNLTSAVITPNQVLKIPTVATTFLYTVKKGDNLYTLAQEYNTTVSNIIEANNLKSNELSVGQQLQIPLNEKSSSNYIIYTVHPGDNLYLIAERYNTTVDDILKLNNLTSNALSIGQQIKVPVLSTTNTVVPYQNYIVKAGDNLYSIAEKFGMTVDELIQLNKLTSNMLSIGQVLKVKGKEYEQIPSGASCYGEGYVEPTYVTYKVQSGDNLYTIARKYGVSVEELMQLNGLTNNNLTIGQILKIREEEV